jgi:hypothetical protein
VHVFDPATGVLIGQNDAPLAAEYWDSSWFRPGVVVKDSHELTLTTPFVSDQHRIFIGVYPSGQPDLPWQMSGYEKNLYSSNTVQIDEKFIEP